MCVCVRVGVWRMYVYYIINTNMEISLYIYIYIYIYRLELERKFSLALCIYKSYVGHYHNIMRRFTIPVTSTAKIQPDEFYWHSVLALDTSSFARLALLGVHMGSKCTSSRALANRTFQVFTESLYASTKLARLRSPCVRYTPL